MRDEEIRKEVDRVWSRLNNYLAWGRIWSRDVYVVAFTIASLGSEAESVVKGVEEYLGDIRRRYKWVRDIWCEVNRGGGKLVRVEVYIEAQDNLVSGFNEVADEIFDWHGMYNVLLDRYNDLRGIAEDVYSYVGKLWG